MDFRSVMLIAFFLPLFHSTFPFPPSVPIRGADIVAKTTLEVIPGIPLTFEWKGHGMKLYVPADALKPDTPTLTMTIQASLSGQYQFPDDTELVSGIYWIAFPRRFSRPVILELQHCAYLEHPDQLSSLSFFTAKCNQKTLPYQFQPLSGGVFSTSTSYGTIDLYHFSGVGVSMRRNKGKGRGGGGKKKDKEIEKRKKQEVEKCYTARVFYIPQVATTWLMHFTIVCDLKLCLKVCVPTFYFCRFVLQRKSLQISGGRNILQKPESRTWPSLGCGI